MIPMLTANRGTWTTHIHNKPNVWKNSAPQERPLNSKLTLHTNAQAHTIYIYIFSFKNTSARASIVQGGEGTAWSWYVWHIFFFYFISRKHCNPGKKKDVDIVGLQCITQRMPERHFYSLKVMWVTVTVGDHRTLWMPSHFWQRPLLTSQVYRVPARLYIWKKGFHCHLGLLTPDANICWNLLTAIWKLRLNWPGRDFRSRSQGLWQKLSRQMVFTNAGSP